MQNPEVLQGTVLLLGLTLAAQGSDMQLEKLAALDFEQFVCDPNHSGQQDPSSVLVPTGSVGIMCLDSQGGAASVLNVVPRQPLAACAVQLGVDGVLAADAGVRQLLMGPMLQQRSAVSDGPLHPAAAAGSCFVLHTQRGRNIKLRSGARSRQQAATHTSQHSLVKSSCWTPSYRWWAASALLKVQL
jgi:hypothetical protein